MPLPASTSSFSDPAVHRPGLHGKVGCRFRYLFGTRLAIVRWATCQKPPSCRNSVEATTGIEPV